MERQLSMKNEEMYIKSRMSTRNPFQVPDGYFDRLADEVMQQLPEQPRQGLVERLRPWLYAAACLLVAVLTATVYFFRPDAPGQNVVATNVSSTNDTYYDEAADYVMADNIDIYACLASEY